MTAPENSSEDPTSRLSDSVRKALELASAERDGELSASESEELATLRLSVGRQVREFRTEAQKVSDLVNAISLSSSGYSRDVFSGEVMRALRSGLLAKSAEPQDAVEHRGSIELQDRVSDASRNRNTSANEPVLLRQNFSQPEDLPNGSRAQERRKRSVVFTAAASFAAMFALLLVMVRSSEHSDRTDGSAESFVATTAGDVTAIGAMADAMSEPAAAAPMAAEAMSSESRSVSNSEEDATATLQAAEGAENHEDWQVLVVRVSSTDPNLIHRRVQEIAAESGFLLPEQEFRRAGSPAERSENAGLSFGVVLKPEVLKADKDQLSSDGSEQAISSLESVEESVGGSSENEERIHRFVEAITGADIVENEEWNPAHIGELTREEALETVRLSLLHPGSSESSLGDLYVAKLETKSAVMKSARGSSQDDSARDIAKALRQPEPLSEKASHSPILIVFQIE
ncbi:MAG: hypothetical protein ACK526_24035 [Planctomyces sp.]